MFNAVIALVIATTKAILVILFFMHVKYSGKHIALVILSGFFFLSLADTHAKRLSQPHLGRAGIIVSCSSKCLSPTFVSWYGISYYRLLRIIELQFVPTKCL